MDVNRSSGGTTQLRHLVPAARWAVIVAAALFVAGIFPFSSGGADGLTGTSGPVTVTVTSDATGLATIHATAPDGIAIYSLTAHICMPGKVNGDHTFDFSGPFCTNVPVGGSDVEKLQTFPGVRAGDLQFRLGEGPVSWTDFRGFPRSMTCDATNVCDLAVRIEITNSTAYFTAPFMGLTPITEPPPAPPGSDPPAPAVDGGTGGAAGGTGAAGGAAASGSGDNCSSSTSTTSTTRAPADPAASSSTTTAPESTCGKDGKKVPGGGSTTGSNSGGKGAVVAGGTSHSSSQGTGDNLAQAREASSVTVGGVDSSRGVRVFVAALLGALCGARILAVIGRTRRRMATT